MSFVDFADSQNGLSILATLVSFANSFILSKSDNKG